MGDGLGEGCPPTIVSLTQGSSRLTKAAAHALVLREIVVFIAPAPSIDKVITGVLLGIKVPAWEGCAARPGDRLGSAVFCEWESRGAQMSRAQEKGGAARVSLAVAQLPVKGELSATETGKLQVWPVWPTRHPPPHFLYLSLYSQTVPTESSMIGTVLLGTFRVLSWSLRELSQALIAVRNSEAESTAGEAGAAHCASATLGHPCVSHTTWARPGSPTLQLP